MCSARAGAGVRSHCNRHAKRLRRRAALATTPYAREPGLLFARQTRRTVVMVEQDEAGGFEVSAPALEIVVGAITARAPALLVLPARIGAEQHAARPQGGRELNQHARQLLARNVEERCIRVHAVE